MLSHAPTNGACVFEDTSITRLVASLNQQSTLCALHQWYLLFSTHCTPPTAVSHPLQFPYVLQFICESNERGRCLRQQFIHSRFFVLLEGLDQFEGNTMHTSTDLQSTSRASLPLILLHRLVGVVRFALFRLETAILPHVQGVLLAFILDLHRESWKYLYLRSLPLHP